jgi:hypothetical protein
VTVLGPQENSGSSIGVCGVDAQPTEADDNAITANMTGLFISFSPFDYLDALTVTGIKSWRFSSARGSRYP